MVLGFSESYTYRTFFKVFTIVVIFGLFYGIVLLPVILSIAPPAPYIQQTSSRKPTETATNPDSNEHDTELATLKSNCD